jgi:hypothetical protein
MAIVKLTKGHADIHTGSKVWIYQGTDGWDMDLDKAIALRLSRELASRNMNPSDMVEVQAVVGGDHGDTAFQFGAAVTAKLGSGDELCYELLSSELICRKDTAALIEATMYPV